MKVETPMINWHDQAPVLSVDCHPSGRIATAGQDGTIRLWKIQERPGNEPSNVEFLSQLEGHGSAVNSVRFSPNGQLLASVSDDRTIIIWQFHSFVRGQKMIGSSSNPASVHLSRIVGQLSRYSNFTLHQAASFAESQSEITTEDSLTKEAPEVENEKDVDEKQTSAVSRDNFETTFNSFETPTPLSSTVPTSSAASGSNSATFSSFPFSSKASTASFNVEIWKSVTSLRAHFSDIYSIAWSPLSDALLSGSVDGNTVLWTLRASEINGVIEMETISETGKSTVVSKNDVIQPIPTSTPAMSSEIPVLSTIDVINTQDAQKEHTPTSTSNSNLYSQIYYDSNCAYTLPYPYSYFSSSRELICPSHDTVMEGDMPTLTVEKIEKNEKNEIQALSVAPEMFLKHQILINDDANYIDDEYMLNEEVENTVSVTPPPIFLSPLTGSISSRFAISAASSHQLGSVQGIAWDPLGQYVVTQSADRSLAVFEVTKSLQKGVYRRRDDKILRFKHSVTTLGGNKTAATSESDSMTSNVHSTPSSSELLVSTLTDSINNKLGTTNSTNTNITHLSSENSGGFPLFCRESQATYFRRLAFSPDGMFLICPAGLMPKPKASSLDLHPFEKKNQTGTHDEKNIEETNMKSTPPVVALPELIPCVHVFNRKNLQEPFLSIPTAGEQSIAIAFHKAPFYKSKGLKTTNTNTIPSKSGLQYKYVFAIVTTRSVLIADTEFFQPSTVAQSFHFSSMSDISWLSPTPLSSFVNSSFSNAFSRKSSEAFSTNLEEKNKNGSFKASITNNDTMCFFLDFLQHSQNQSANRDGESPVASGLTTSGFDSKISSSGSGNSAASDGFLKSFRTIQLGENLDKMPDKITNKMTDTLDDESSLSNSCLGNFDSLRHSFIMTSQDGYCTFVHFEVEELGVPLSILDLFAYELERQKSHEFIQNTQISLLPKSGWIRSFTSVVETLAYFTRAEKQHFDTDPLNTKNTPVSLLFRVLFRQVMDILCLMYSSFPPNFISQFESFYLRNVPTESKTISNLLHALSFHLDKVLLHRKAWLFGIAYKDIPTCPPYLSLIKKHQANVSIKKEELEKATLQASLRLESIAKEKNSVQTLAVVTTMATMGNIEKTAGVEENIEAKKETDCVGPITSTSISNSKSSTPKKPRSKTKTLRVASTPHLDINTMGDTIGCADEALSTPKPKPKRTPRKKATPGFVKDEVMTVPVAVSTVKSVIPPICILSETDRNEESFSKDVDISVSTPIPSIDSVVMLRSESISTKHPAVISINELRNSWENTAENLLDVKCQDTDVVDKSIQPDSCNVILNSTLNADEAMLGASSRTTSHLSLSTVSHSGAVRKSRTKAIANGMVKAPGVGNTLITSFFENINATPGKEKKKHDGNEVYCSSKLKRLKIEHDELTEELKNASSQNEENQSPSSIQE